MSTDDRPSRELSLTKLIGQGYDEFWNTKCRYVVVRGSRASKKSYTTAYWIIINMMAYPDANTLVVRKIYDTLRDSCYALLEKVIHMLGVQKRWRCVRSPLEMVYIPTGQKIIFRGLDDPYKLSSLDVTHGKLCWGWLEEAYQVNREEDFDRIDESLRGVMPQGLWIRWMITFNPWSKAHWLRTKFFENEDGTPLVDPMVYAFRTNYLINEWCSPEDKKFFERMRQLNPRQYEVAGLGNWGTPEGMIYDNWEEFDFDYNKVAKMEGIQSVCGLDFGFSADPTAMCCALVDEANYTIWVYDELYEKGLTSKMRAKRIKEMGHAKSEIVYDSANPLDAQELLEEGIMNLIPANKTGQSILNGINRIRDYKIYVHPRCVNFITEIQNYSWFVDKDGVTQPKPAPGQMDHLMDACLRKGTLITTIDGDIAIEDIKIGDRVLTHDGYCKVSWSGLTKEHERLYRIRTNGYHEFYATYNHKVYVKHYSGQREFIDVLNVKKSDSLMNVDGKWEKVIECKITNEYDDVYDLTIDYNHDFFANGVLVHNCRYMMQGVKSMGRGGFIGSVEEEDLKKRYAHEVPTEEQREQVKEMVFYLPKHDDDEDDDDNDDSDLEYGIVYST